MIRKNDDLKQNYHIVFEKSVIISLIVIIVLFLLFPTLKPRIAEEKIVNLNIIVEDIPITKQGIFRPPPPKPVVPIPSEDEIIPEDVTIEETDLRFNTSPVTSTGGSEGFGVPSHIAPRPIAEVIPEYPKEDYKKGVTGIVKLHVKINENGKVVDVIILENSTKSKRCANAAKKAAYQCRYIPARQGKKSISCWITRIIKFDIPE